jgi:hypothetical protein
MKVERGDKLLTCSLLQQRTKAKIKAITVTVLIIFQKDSIVGRSHEFVIAAFSTTANLNSSETLKSL